MLADTSDKSSQHSQLYRQLLLTQDKYQASAAAQEIHMEVLIC